MEDGPKPRERQLSRSYHCSRFEEQLWSMAYECVWPAIRRTLTEYRAEQHLQEDQETALATNVARRA